MPNSVGGISVANNLLANSAIYNLNKNQSQLGTEVQRLSSGLRVNTAADDPSGLAIAENLQAQVSGFDQAAQNVQNANNAVNVADGALSSVTDILQRVRQLAVEASQSTNSTDDLNALQSEINQLLQEVNTISQGVNFNGQNLLDGSHSGFTAAVDANATITFNSAIGAGGNLVSSVTFSATNATSISDGTIELQVTQLSATQVGIVVNFFSSASGVGQQVSVVTLGAAASGFTSIIVDGVTVNFQQATFQDVNTIAYIKVTQFVSAASNPSSPSFTFQAGADEGDEISVGIQSVSTATLRISNVNVATTGGYAFLGAEDTIGQIDQALNSVNDTRAALGAVVTRLNIDSSNDEIASNNLQASESAIRDLNVATETADYNRTQILVQIGTTVLAQSNANAQTVLGLFR